MYLFFIGLFKKIMIADELAPVASFGFDTASGLTFVEAWVTSLSYTLQIYFDFSAYTDMALGASLLFNIRLPFNFNSPYKAENIADFWRRWHMTLSRFLRDYIYIPLGGNRAGRFNTSRNLMLTFLIGGIWHGAGWTFVFWGFLHGVATVIHRLWGRLNITMHHAVAWFLTFNFVNVTWIFFRARTWDDAVKVLKGMAGLNGIMLSRSAEKIAFFKKNGFQFGDLFFPQVNRNAVALLVVAFIIARFFRNSDEMTAAFAPDWKTAVFISGIAVYALLSMNKVTEFLYFNF
jgi:D-alanyl-lipoteichoic acid acyltransferase DltB (MBOAT superfamily)